VKIEGRGEDGNVKSPLQEEEERFLTAQTDAFARAKAEEKLGLLLSE
jgi:hypothetical protein